MSTQLYRTLAVGANVLLLVAIGAVGFRVVRGGGDDLKVPALNPTQYEVARQDNQASGVDVFQVVWQQMDKPKPVQTMTPTPQVERPQQPSAQSLASRYELVWALVNPERPERSSCIIANRGGANQRALSVGDRLDGYEVESIQIEDAGDAVVTIKDGSTPVTIRLAGATQ